MLGRGKKEVKKGRDVGWQVVHVKRSRREERGKGGVTRRRIGGEGQKVQGVQRGFHRCQSSWSSTRASVNPFIRPVRMVVIKL